MWMVILAAVPVAILLTFIVLAGIGHALKKTDTSEHRHRPF
jgi:hypothetical protein